MALATKEATKEVSATGMIEPLIAATPSCVIKPFSFFVSWQGVLTLVYRGFPPALANLKETLNGITSLAPENSGSKWPKTSLGALKDGVRLTPHQFDVLNSICREESGWFQNPQAPKSQALLVDQLSVVTYECRCLERQLSKQVVPLLPGPDTREVAASEHDNVQAVLAESGKPDYWFHVSKDGNRHNHYKGNALGVTLVYELACFRPGDHQGFGSGLPAIIKSFRERVDRDLPGLYSWFDNTSLHVTVRALVN